MISDCLGVYGVWSGEERRERGERGERERGERGEEKREEREGERREREEGEVWRIEFPDCEVVAPKNFDRDDSEVVSMQVIFSLFLFLFLSFSFLFLSFSFSFSFSFFSFWFRRNEGKKRLISLLPPFLPLSPLSLSQANSFFISMVFTRKILINFNLQLQHMALFRHRYSERQHTVMFLEPMDFSIWVVSKDGKEQKVFFCFFV